MAGLGLYQGGVSNARMQSGRSSPSMGWREKFFGCIAGCHVGSAMGTAVEGWPYEPIEQVYGVRPGR